jgi:hypothetical protein
LFFGFLFVLLPESANILEPTEASDVKILKKVGLCVDEQFYYNTNKSINSQSSVIKLDDNANDFALPVVLAFT